MLLVEVLQAHVVADLHAHAAGSHRALGLAAGGFDVLQRHLTEGEQPPLRIG